MDHRTLGDVSQGRSNNFDFLRLILAVAVILEHSYALALGSYVLDPVYRFTHGQMYSGEVAVNGFFLISGFLITASWLRSRTAGDYAAKRCLRIYPGAIAAILVCLLVVAPLGAEHPLDVFRQLRPLNLLFSFIVVRVPPLQGVFTHLFFTGAQKGSVNGSLWSIRFELGCYVMTALFGVIGLMRRPRWVAGLALCSFALALYIVYHGVPSVSSSVDFYVENLFRLITYYLAGTLAYLYRDAIPYRRAFFWASLAIVLAAGVWTGLQAMMPVFGAYALFYLAFSRSLRAENIGKYGDFSYGIYLYGWPSQQLLLHYFRGALTPVPLFFAATALSAVMAGLSWHLVEKRFLKRKRRIVEPEPDVPPLPAAGAEVRATER